VIIAYVNISGLWIARAVSQQQEQALQYALGASRRRVRSQLPIQALVSSAVAIIFGLIIG
jgi:ABC-type antimicrobial peptide transport system permease subunit